MIEFTNRQLDIIEILKKHEPITAEQIAELLSVSKTTIRSDLAVLVMTGYLDAKPKVGYFLGNAAKYEDRLPNKLHEIKVKDIQGLPVIIQGKTPVHDAVISLFMEDVGTLVVVDSEGYLEGIVSRKDLLKVTLGNANTTTIPVHLVMTRHPNIYTVLQDDPILEAARKMVQFEVDSLPVVEPDNDQQPAKQLVVGRITKTHLTKVLLEISQER
ncbi:helix-turn-helix transcriptional regulator [Aquibacillus kalidii]|uniref:helix-turn-helix transcriptional regulator n=1 Tax=Aquibacillus kalidii TaxID=2762597 RepID=UPI0016466F78|nr:helix-turn-helix transcriptional regulator [Aquibacillus kalidii]